MKAVILAGGLGTRIAEETNIRPKPMIEIGGKPILWHIMKIYAHYGINEFIICLGYKGYVIKEYFFNYYLHTSDVTIDLGTNSLDVHYSSTDPWRVTMVDTGELTMTGGRLKRIAQYVAGERFCLTYGDGVSNVDIGATIKAHDRTKNLVTVTAVQPPGRFGALETQGDQLRAFREKPKGDGSWVNGGFFVVEPAALNYIDGDSTVWEAEPLENLATEGKVGIYKHDGFWQPLDTIRDRMHLEHLWSAGSAPWKVWN